MNESLYKEKLIEFSEIEIKNILAKNNCDFLTGKSGAVLFYLHKFQVTKQKLYLIKAKFLLEICLSKIFKYAGETSFFVGPLGIIWLIFLYEDISGLPISEQVNCKKLVENYLEVQSKKKEFENSPLDFIYGMTGWFIIYPYLPSKLQNKVIEIFKEKALSQIDNFIISDGTLGFAHGLSSVYFILREYKIDVHKNILIRLNDIILKNIKDDFKLARFNGSSDFIRQDWCHGQLGLALNFSKPVKNIDNYLLTKCHPFSHGVCHGLGQRFLINKLASQLFNRTMSLVEIPQMEFNIHTVPFIESYIIGLMSLELDLARDAKFSWWRICYPLNRKYLETI